MTTGTIAPRIRVVGLNPALDRLQVIDAFTAHGVNRARQVTSHPGGKGLIVARVIRRLGHPVTLYGFLGGAIGELIANECRQLTIDDRHVRIAGETRISPIMVESGTGRTTVVNEPGPTIHPEELAELKVQLERDVRAGDYVILTGSLPPGVPADFYADAVKRVQAAGAFALVDTSGEALAHAVAAAPRLLKVSAHEFVGIAPSLAPDDGPALLTAMGTIRSKGVPTVIVTLGGAGSLAVDGEHAYRIRTGDITTVNATGSGDAFLAALTSTLAFGTVDGAHGLVPALRMASAAGAANAMRLEPDVGSLDDVLAQLPGAAVDFLPAPAGPDAP
ncbi:MAG TPA: 1-phosphofructokinase family hexose kinase [Jatrophihabitantaceae bacterium]|nr:1-phosphofructokinase family hexose kinase [Jatrophihabitantaceae bacterium]